MAIRHLAAGLTLAIALGGILPLFPWLDPAPRLLLAAGWLAGAWQSWRGAWPLRPWLVNTATLGGVLFYALQITRANPAPAMASMLAVVLAVRLLGEKSSRHCLQIQALALFCLAASSLFSLSAAFLLFLALLIFLVALALVVLTFHDHDPNLVLAKADLRRVLGAGLLMPMATLPLLVVFFPILPRTQLPMWDFGLKPDARQTGFSDRVEPGRSSEMNESGRLAFRAEMPRQAGQELYWRGVVLNRLEGSRWLRDTAVPAEQLRYGNARLGQDIYLEPGLTGFLPGLDAPTSVTLPRARRSTDGIFTSSQPASSRRLRYRVESAVNDGVLGVTGGIDRDFYLDIADSSLSPRLRQLAESIRAQGEEDTDRLERLEQHFLNNHYRYTMRGMPTGDQALEDFLFDSRQGNCEFFAAAFALLARAAGLPARLVGGYLGGEYNDLGGYYLVRDKMAHAWVEVFVEGKGWVRCDPSRFAANAGELWGGGKRPGLLRRLRLGLDSLDHLWNRAVLTYDFARQVEIAATVGRQVRALPLERALHALLPASLVLAGGMGLVLVLRRRRRLFPSAQERLLNEFFRHLEADCALKVVRGREGLFELAQRSGSPRAQEFARRYARAVYRDQPLSRAELAALRQLLRQGLGRER